MIDPPRLMDDPATDAALRETLRAASQHAPPLDVSAGLARLEAEIGTSGTAASGGMTGAIVAATVTVAVLGGIAWWSTRAPSGPVGDTDASPTTEEVLDARTAEPPPEAQPIAAHADVPEEPAPEPRVARQPRAARPVEPSVAAHAASAEGDDDSLAREMSQLAEARRALPADPTRALALLERGRREFPDSLFAEERDALRVLALFALDRDEEAGALSERFLAAHPTSPFAERVRRAAR